jgi:hypothetical protein
MNPEVLVKAESSDLFISLYAENLTMRRKSSSKYNFRCRMKNWSLFFCTGFYGIIKLSEQKTNKPCIREMRWSVC